jgi:hypothetical protein
MAAVRNLMRTIEKSGMSKTDFDLLIEGLVDTSDNSLKVMSICIKCIYIYIYMYYIWHKYVCIYRHIIHIFLYRHLNIIIYM